MKQGGDRTSKHVVKWKSKSLEAKFKDLQSEGLCKQERQSQKLSLEMVFT